MVLAPAPGRAQFGLGAKETPAGTFLYDGKNVDYWQFEPRNKGTEPLPAIVILHGIEGLEAVADNNANDLKDYKQLCQIVAEKGYVVRFVHYMQSTPVAKGQVAKLEGKLKDSLVAPADKVDADARKLFDQWMKCVKAGTDDLAKNAVKNGIDPARIGVVGLSLGGFVVTSLAVTDPKFSPQALIIVCGGLPEELHAKVDKLPPVLMICAKKDEIIPPAHSRKVWSCLDDKDCSCQMLSFPCCHMFFDQPKAQGGTFQTSIALRALEYAEVFLRQNVQNAPKSVQKAPKDGK
jgi:dienelactone hydrolase